MGVALDAREVEYCFVSKFLFQFNLEISDGMGFAHMIVILYDLLDKDRNKLADIQEKLTLKITDSKLTAEQFMGLLADVEVQAQISNAILNTKKIKSGFMLSK